jgi:hypothetical protein
MFQFKVSPVSSKVRSVLSPNRQPDMSLGHSATKLLVTSSRAL